MLSTPWIFVEWQNYDFEHWNSDQLNYKVYWKFIASGSNTTDINLDEYQSFELSGGLITVDNTYLLDTSFIINNLLPFAKYSILVSTLNDVGEGAFIQLFQRTQEGGKFVP